MKLTVHVRKGTTGAVQAYCPDLPGCAASARTETEALRLLRRRVDEHFSETARNAPPGTRIHVIEV